VKAGSSPRRNCKKVRSIHKLDAFPSLDLTLTRRSRSHTGLQIAFALASGWFDALRPGTKTAEYDYDDDYEHEHENEHTYDHDYD
jgi:hypothetical protein